MHELGRVADGLAAWLRYEMRCGRKALFSEEHLASPIAELLRDHYPGRLHRQVKHELLAAQKETSGRKACVDFGVPLNESNNDSRRGDPVRYQLLVETKWLSKSNTLLRDILRDLVRLAMLMPDCTENGAVIVAGRKKKFESLFDQRAFRPMPNNPSSSTLLPQGHCHRKSIRLSNPSRFRARFISTALAPFRGIEIPVSLTVEKFGPYPIYPKEPDAEGNPFQVYVWNIRAVSADRFTP